MLAVVLTVSLAATGAHAAGVPISDEAREHFRQGVALLQGAAGPQYRQAYQQFEAAYHASPSPKILGNVGMCAMELERDGEAIAAYERYLAEAGALNQEDRKQILSELARLGRRSAPLGLVVTPPDAVVVDSRQARATPVVNRYTVTGGVLNIRVRAGSHVTFSLTSSATAMYPLRHPGESSSPSLASLSPAP